MLLKITQNFCKRYSNLLRDVTQNWLKLLSISSGNVTQINRQILLEINPEMLLKITQNIFKRYPN